VASLISLQGRGGGRVPTRTGTIDLSRADLTTLIRELANELYPHVGYGAALLRLSQRDDASRLIAERAGAYPAAPASTPPPAPLAPAARRTAPRERVA
jgi:hypothetical protein